MDDLNELEQLLVIEEKLRAHGSAYLNVLAYIHARLAEVDSIYAPELEEPEPEEPTEPDHNPAPTGAESAANQLEKEPDEWPTTETSLTNSDETPPSRSGRVSNAGVSSPGIRRT